MLPKLRKLNLNGNVIETCKDFSGHNTLEILELRKNKTKKMQRSRKYAKSNRTLHFRKRFRRFPRAPSLTFPQRITFGHQ